MTQANPAVDILVAVYRPNPDFFRTQLTSLNAQDYPNLRILLLDDSGDDVQHAHIEAMAKECLTTQPYLLFRNEVNLGVSATFQRLTERSDASLLAYCDQDDIWLPEKVTRLEALLEKPEAILAYSNLAIIDGQGRLLYETLQAMNPRFTHKAGAGLFPYFLQDNCVTGCTLMIRREAALAALPFPEAFVHDQWLSLCASAQGTIAYDPAPLIRYRLHGQNVVGMDSLSGVTDRKSYVSERLRPQMRMLETAEITFTAPVQRQEILRQKRALQKRMGYLEERRLYLLPSLIHSLWQDPLRLGLETLLGIAPQRMGERLIAFARRH